MTYSFKIGHLTPRIAINCTHSSLSTFVPGLKWINKINKHIWNTCSVIHTILKAKSKKKKPVFLFNKKFIVSSWNPFNPEHLQMYFKREEIWFCMIQPPIFMFTWKPFLLEMSGLAEKKLWRMWSLKINLEGKCNSTASLTV